MAIAPNIPNIPNKPITSPSTPPPPVVNPPVSTTPPAPTSVDRVELSNNQVNGNGNSALGNGGLASLMAGLEDNFGVSQPGRNGNSSQEKDSGGGVPHPPLGLAEGINSAGQTKQVNEAATTARKNEVNRPGRGPSGETQLQTSAEKLKADGHELTKTNGRKLNGEFVEGSEKFTGKPYGPKTEMVDGKKKVKAGEWVPPHDPSKGAHKVTIGPDGLEADRVHGAHNKTGGGYSAPKGSMDGLTKKEIQQKLALDQKPTHLQNVTHKPGSEMNHSVVGAQPGHGQKGGDGVQFENRNIENGESSKLSDTKVRTERFANGLNKAGKVFKPVSVVTDALALTNAFKADGNKVGSETVKEVANVAGGAAGALAGAKGGAIVGAALGSVFPGPGTVVGGVVGSLVGGVTGGLAGGKLGDVAGNVGEKAKDVASAVGDKAKSVISSLNPFD